MWLRAHAEAIEGLLAEEAFRDAEIAAVGSGNIKERERDKILHRWNQSLNPGGARITAQNVGMIKGMGIGLRLVGK